MEWEYWFTMKVFIKDAKAKITIESIELKGVKIDRLSDSPPILTFKSYN